MIIENNNNNLHNGSGNFTPIGPYENHPVTDSFSITLHLQVFYLAISHESDRPEDKKNYAYIFSFDPHIHEIKREQNISCNCCSRERSI